MTNNNAFIIDIDHTIINTDLIKPAIVGLINKYQPTTLNQVNEIIHTTLQNGGFYTWQGVIGQILPDSDHKQQDIDTIIERIFSLPFEDYYYTGTIVALEQLAKLGTVIVFSQGEDVLQHKKSQCLIDRGILRSENIYIYKDKIAEVPAFLESLKDQKKFVFDDLIRFLAAFGKQDPAIVTILVETRQLDQDLSVYQPTMRVQTFAEAVKKVEAMLT